MTSKDIILYAALIVGVGFSLYRRYMKSKQARTGDTGKVQSPPSSFPPVKDDDYEPYSKK
jgi:hypothetical protein